MSFMWTHQQASYNEVMCLRALSQSKPICSALAVGAHEDRWVCHLLTNGWFHWYSPTIPYETEDGGSSLLSGSKPKDNAMRKGNLRTSLVRRVFLLGPGYEYIIILPYGFAFDFFLIEVLICNSGNWHKMLVRQTNNYMLCAHVNGYRA